jgi:hypothetical protein
VNKVFAFYYACVFVDQVCATIVGDDTQLVQVNSNPAGAAFEIKDDSGRVVAQERHRKGVTLAKSDGSYFSKKSYQIVH